MKKRKVRLSSVDYNKVIAHINAYQKRSVAKPTPIITYTYLGGVFGELHFWR